MQFINRILLVSLTLTLVACDRGGASPATQVAAKVNKDEISVHQINAAMANVNTAGAPDAAVKQAKAQVLERLIDQDLMVQKAQESKLDRDPKIMQALEGARRQILAQAYLERKSAGVQKPKPEEVKAFYSAHPELFSQRRIYKLQEIKVQTNADQARQLQAAVAKAGSMNDVLNFLKAQDLKFAGAEGTKPAEQLPMTLLPKLSVLKDGQFLVFPGANGSNVTYLAGSQSAPLNEQQATPYIEQFLQNEQRRKLMDEELKSVRASAKIEYVGEFANREAAAPAPATVPSAVSSDAKGGDAKGSDGKSSDPNDFIGRGISGMR